MGIVSGPLSRDDYLKAIGQIVEFLRSNGIRELHVAYGWSCACPDDQLWQEVAMPLERLQSFIFGSRMDIGKFTRNAARTGSEVVSDALLRPPTQRLKLTGAAIFISPAP